MSTIIPNTDQIYFPQTRENFNEVFSSYGVGNYRSAVVMLYATTVCDILLKLQELRDTYNDGVAKNILEEIDKSRQGGLGGNGKCKSAWEWELIESVRKQTDFFDNESYITLQHLYDYRNMCAHPAVNDSYELYKPDQEIVIALIKSVLKTILCKPPIYIKGVFDTLTNDLASKKDDFENDKEHLKRYLDNRYYDRMSDGMKLKAAKSLWKICFVVDDDECNRNRLINRRALEILTEEIEKEFIDQIANDKNHYTVNENDGIKLHLLSYLAKYPNVYQPLSEDLKYTIDRFIEKNSIAKSISWFKEGINPEFLNVLDPGVGINSSVLPEMYERFSKNGYKKEVLDFFIKYLGESYNFDTADERFDKDRKSVV